ncbi:aspartate aminotransferase family protein [Oceanispirochaeta sp.]|uniref:aspartate aminotransferase family protein n=1 Tax=Oceanispirochaeta sp. TaxID=2035350 RepID=UPI00261EE48D|nr:acetylornithine/succinylornithine family transaminase [Oceanispirochaeta sp.]MDA3957776.1 acetylornithine/succinylornithine family transaminase [Oceanispirochaeta sp.]
MKPYIIEKPALPKNFAERFLQIESGKGSYVYDKGGKEYLDFGSGIAVNALGYGREDLAKAAYDQMKKLIHVSNLYTTGPTVELAEKLVKTGNFTAVHFGNSGSEANEAALKYARLYAKMKKGPESVGFVSFSNGFHGRTMGALSVTATEKYKTPFSPLLSDCIILPFNDPDSLKTIKDPRLTAAIIVEVIQGEGGLVSLSEKMVKALNEFCAQYDIILIADEVQTGVGRTGSFYASDEAGLKADIITLAKPLAGGLPLSATLIPAKINDLLHPGDHGTTFGGGPVTSTVALSVLEKIQSDGFLNSVKEKGLFLDKELKKSLKSLDLQGDILGKGLLRGLKIPSLKPESMAALMNTCQDQGLLILRSGQNIIRIAPPLTISENELQKGVTILFKAIKEII